ncbi:MAG: SixA phosphatase family protein [Anaerolineae bacterium]
MPHVLLVMRHAKAAQDNLSLVDRERQLTRNGKADAERLGTELRTRNLVPDVIYCSPAKRARTTAKRVAHCSGYSDEVEVVEVLYMRGAKAYLRVISDWSDELNCGMVVGHNPDVSSLIQLLTGTQAEMATAAIAVIRVPVDHWSELESLPSCKLVEILN